MDEQPGVARAREPIQLYMNGEYDRLRDFYSDDVVWHAGGNNPLGGDNRGRDDLMEYFEKVRSMTGGTLRLEPMSILESDAHTAMFTRVTAQREDRTLDVTLA